MKGIFWLYLIIYTLYLALTFVMLFVTKNATISMALHFILLIIPSFVAFQALKGKPVHFAYSVAGLLLIAPII